MSGDIVWRHTHVLFQIPFYILASILKKPYIITPFPQFFCTIYLLHSRINNKKVFKLQSIINNFWSFTLTNVTNNSTHNKKSFGSMKYGGKTMNIHFLYAVMNGTAQVIFHIFAFILVFCVFLEGMLSGSQTNRRTARLSKRSPHSVQRHSK